MTAPALSLWPGRTIHARLKPFEHRFRYPIAYIGLDIDRLDEAAAQSRFFSVGKFNLLGFYPQDHGPRNGTSLSEWASGQFAQIGVDVSRCSVRLLCQPRVLGYQFNPISLWIAHDHDGDVRGLLYEVHNTFGDAHTYAVRIDTPADLHHSAAKHLHVSPFFTVEGEYAFSLRQEGDRVSLGIRKTVCGKTDFTASMTVSRKPATDASIWNFFLRQPFSTHRTIASIHWEALRLWLKGARYQPRPVPPSRALTPARFDAGAVSE